MCYALYDANILQTKSVVSPSLSITNLADSLMLPIGLDWILLADISLNQVVFPRDLFCQFTIACYCDQKWEREGQ